MSYIVLKADTSGDGTSYHVMVISNGLAIAEMSPLPSNLLYLLMSLCFYKGK